MVLAIFATGTVALLVAGPRLRAGGGRRLCVVLAVLNLAVGAVSSLLALSPFTLRHSLPLQLCDLAWVVVAAALLTRRPTAVALTYYWGLTLSVQALVQPTLSEAFPDPRFFAFWVKHVAIVWGAVLLGPVLRVGPDWRGYRRALGWTLVWLLVVVSLNPLLGANYGYVNGKPAGGSVLDRLGPWPAYVVAEAAIVVVGWALITLPWVRPVSTRGSRAR